MESCIEESVGKHQKTKIVHIVCPSSYPISKYIQYVPKDLISIMTENKLIFSSNTKLNIPGSWHFGTGLEYSSCNICWLAKWWFIDEMIERGKESTACYPFTILKRYVCCEEFLKDTDIIKGTPIQCLMRMTSAGILILKVNWKSTLGSNPLYRL